MAEASAVATKMIRKETAAVGARLNPSRWVGYRNQQSRISRDI
jgi:hypothetical protein